MLKVLQAKAQRRFEVSDESSVSYNRLPFAERLRRVDLSGLMVMVAILPGPMARAI